MYEDSQILFPPHVIHRLAGARGPGWRGLVERVTSRAADDPEALAFSLLMIRLDGCLSCEMDSYRAMRGCTACALQTLHRFKGTDEDLLRRFDRALQDVMAYLAGLPEPRISERIEPARAA